MLIIAGASEKKKGFFEPLDQESMNLLMMVGTQLKISLLNLEYSKSLENMVKLRTMQLEEKSRNIRAMMQNLKQGLFTILDNGIIHDEYSEHLEDVLETGNIAGENLHDLLLDRATIDENSRNQICSQF